MAYLRDITQNILYGTGDVVAKSARTTSGNSGWIDIGDASMIVAQLHADAGTGTLPTLDVKIMTSYNGVDATEIGIASGIFTQVLAVLSSQMANVTASHRYIKIVWVIAGATPSFNFGVYLTTRA